MNWVEIFNTFGVAGLIIVGAIWLAKLYFNYRVHIKQEEFKIKFSKLHLDRAEVIKEIHSQFIVLSESVVTYLNSFPSNTNVSNKIESDYLDEIVRNSKEYTRLFLRNRIFFDDNIVYDMANVVLIINEMIAKYAKYNMVNNDNNSEEYRQNLAAIVKSLNDKLTPITNNLESEFRKLMGVEKQTKKS